jgi:acetyltransferase
VSIRASRHHDQAALSRFYGELGHGTLRRRFHGALNGLSPARIRDLTDPALLTCGQVCSRVAWCADADGILVAAHGLWRLDAHDSAEFALVVADAWQGEGLGMRVMRALLDEASRRGLSRLHAHVLRDNTAMLQLLDRLGATPEPDPDDARVLRVELDVLPHTGLPRVGLHLARLEGWLRGRAAGPRAPKSARGLA